VRKAMLEEQKLDILAKAFEQLAIEMVEIRKNINDLKWLVENRTDINDQGKSWIKRLGTS
jgi:hypothetical protein